MAADVLVLYRGNGTILEAHQVFRLSAPTAPDQYRTKLFDRPVFNSILVGDDDIKKDYFVDAAGQLERKP